MHTSERTFIPIPGTSSVTRLEENAGAVNLKLSQREVNQLEQTEPPDAVGGARYDEAMARLLGG